MSGVKRTSDGLEKSTASTDSAETAELERLLKLYTKLRSNDDTKTSSAVENILRELDTIGRAEKFFEWAGEDAKTTLHFNRDCFKETKGDDTIDWLKKANWKLGGKALSVVNSRLSYSGRDTAKAYIPLGRLSGSWLALRKDNEVMVPGETSGPYLEARKIISVNSNNILGLHYEPVGSKVGNEILFFAQLDNYHGPTSRLTKLTKVFLGNIMSTKIQQQDTVGHGLRSGIVPLGPWYDTGYVLALEILESGLGGKYYIIRNLTSQEDWEGLPDATVQEDQLLVSLCGKIDPFTVARLEDQGGTLLKRNWRDVDGGEDLDFEVLSKVRPQVVETGIVEDGKDKSNSRIVALSAVGGW